MELRLHCVERFELVGGILGSCCVEWLPGLGSRCGLEQGPLISMEVRLHCVERFELVGGILGSCSCCVEWLPGLGSRCGARTGTADQHGATSSLRGTIRFSWIPPNAASRLKLLPVVDVRFESPYGAQFGFEHL